MEIEKIDNNTFLVSFPISNLEKSSISITSFMSNSIEYNYFIDNIKQNIINFYNLNCSLKEFYTYLIKDKFLIYFKTNKNYYEFQSTEDFNNFCEFISTTKFAKDFYFNSEKKEISLSKDISNNFFYLLKEFAV